MRAKFIKLILTTVVIIILLMLVASPVTASACMEMTAGDFDSGLCQSDTATPSCCLSTECPPSHHVLTNTVNTEILLPNRSTPKVITCLIWFSISSTTETCLDPRKPFQQELTKELPFSTFVEYHCRDSLGSEDPH